MPSKDEILTFRRGLPCYKGIARKSWEGGRGELTSFSSESFPQDFQKEVREGLHAADKSIPCRYFYDRRGSRLFEQIGRLPEYYLTRVERRILKSYAPLLVKRIIQDRSVLELGGGNGEKIFSLFKSCPRRKRFKHYIPLDLSKAVLESSIPVLLKRDRSLWVTGLHANYEEAFKLLGNGNKTHRVRNPLVLFFLGSNIGNFLPHQRRFFLSQISSFLSPSDRFVFGADLKKDRSVLEAAYNDKQGVTAFFNLNILSRMNRELNSNFNPKAFRHVAFYHEKEGRIEMHLESIKNQKVRIGTDEIFFKKRETIHTENSYKFSIKDLDKELLHYGLQVEVFFTDPKEWFGLWVLARNQSLPNST